MANNLFEIATRKGYRYPAGNGMITTEDLWSLPLTSTKGPSLNAIAIRIHKELKDLGEVSFIDSTHGNRDLELKLEVVKEVITQRKEEAQARKDNAERVMKKQRIAELLAQKEDAELMNKSSDELRQLMESL